MASTNTHFHSVIGLMRKVQIFAAKGPAYHYTYGYWRLRRWLSPWLAGADRVSDEAFVAKLALQQPALLCVRSAHQQKSLQQTKAALRDYFQTRRTPSFFFKAAQSAPIVSLIDQLVGEQKAQTIALADAICRNVFHFRRSAPVHFPDRIDWQHAPDGNRDWSWDLNRHAYFEALGRAYHYTGDERYARKFRALVLDWLAHNPAQVSQMNWASIFEVAFRINTWLWAFHFFRAAPSFDETLCFALIKGLWTHGHFLDAHLELHNRNNHLLLEAKALAMLGLLFPEFAAAAEWRKRGLALFYQELRAQVCTDGVHGERATHYHRVITGETLELLVLLAENGIEPPADIMERFAKMIDFEQSVTKPDGRIALVGDSALEDVHLRFSGVRGAAAFLARNHPARRDLSLTEAEIWLLGAQRVQRYLAANRETQPAMSQAFPSGGYFVMSSGAARSAHFLLFDCGPFGYTQDATHGHADALSLELYAGDRTWLVDPGVYSTHLGWSWRRFFRGTQAHNTVMVDEQDQSVLLDSRRVYRPARTTLHRWLSRPTFDFVDGSHDGYTRLVAPVVHRRQIYYVKGEYWILVDLLSGEGRHTFDLLFHLMPGVAVDLEQRGTAHCHSVGATTSFQLIPLGDRELQTQVFSGAVNPIQGWVSLYSGEKVAAPTLRYRQACAAPTYFCTVLYPQPADKAPGTIKVSSYAVTADDSSPDAVASTVTALAIDNGQHRDHLLLDRSGSHRRKCFDEIETDAELLFLRISKRSGLPVQIVMRGGRHLTFRGESLATCATANGVALDQALDW